MDVYEKLFDEIANRKMTGKKENEAEKRAFVSSVATCPQTMDYARYAGMHGKELFTCLYFSAFQKMPSQEDAIKTENMKDEEIVALISRAPAFFLRKNVMENCPFSVKTPRLRAVLFNALYKVKNSVFLRKVAKKMPLFIQKRIRGAFG